MGLVRSATRDMADEVTRVTKNHVCLDPHYIWNKHLPSSDIDTGHGGRAGRDGRCAWDALRLLGGPWRYESAAQAVLRTRLGAQRKRLGEGSAAAAAASSSPGRR